MRLPSGRQPRYWAVIPSAGGARMGLGRPRQYLQLRAKALIEWSIGPFLDAGWIDGVVAVLARGDNEFAKLPIARHPKLLVAVGGASRAESVLAGLRAIEARSGALDAPTFALIHESSRPCLIVEDLERLRDEASDEHGGLLALPVSDTLKREARERDAGSVDSRDLWRAQTPQLFRADLLRAALAAQGGGARSDEATAMERAGYRPKLIRSRESNLKVSAPEDLPLAEFWLSRQEYVR